eukprot:s2515_g3.t2
MLLIECTDLRVFPDTNNWSLQAAYLAWNVANENEVFGPPTNRGAIFQVSAFGQDHVLKTNEQNYRPKPSASGHRYASAALASKYTGRAVVRTEDDLLYLRSLPTFEDRLRPSDAEALLSFLTVPYIRMPLMLSFFTSADRVNCLFSDTLRSILHAVVLEPGKFLMPGRWHDCPQMVPAASAAEAELLATPFGQLLTELSCSPKMPLSLSGRLLELALVLANSVTSDTVGVVLFAIRVAARVESATSLLLRAHSGGIKSSPLLAASLNMSENVLAELRAGKQYLRMASELVGKAAPDFEIELEDGSKKKLSAFLAEGKPVDSSISLQQIQDLLVQLLVGGSRLGTASQLLESAEAIASFVPCQCHAAVEKRPQVISFWPAFAERVSRLVASQSLDGPIMARIVGGHLAEPQQLDALQLPEVVALARDAAHLGEPQVRLAAAIGHRVGGPGLSALKLKDH